jgi:hypothetical protein
MAGKIELSGDASAAGLTGSKWRPGASSGSGLR